MYHRMGSVGRYRLTFLRTKEISLFLTDLKQKLTQTETKLQMSKENENHLLVHVSAVPL